MKLKRLLSSLLVLCMLVSFVPISETKVSAANDAIIQQRIDELKANLAGKYFTTNQKTCGNSACSACMVNNVITQPWFTNIFGKIPSVNNLAKYYYFANDVNYAIGGPTLGQYSCAGFASFAEWYIFKNSNSDSVQTELVGVYPVSEVSKHAMLGDMLRIKWWSSSRGTWSYHSGIYLGQNSSNSVYILDCNGGTSRNQVLVHNFTCDSVVITRAKNRNVSGSGLSGIVVSPTTPTPHSHSWSYSYESSHPHKQYRICSSCGAKEYTGAQQTVKTCSLCYPLGSIKLTREFDRTSGKATFYRNDVSNADRYMLNIYRNGSLQTSRDMSSTSYTTTLVHGYSYSATLTATNTNTGESRSTSCSDFKIYNTYSVSYNANGGSGAPSSQTKIQDENLTLSSTKPTKEHYVFKGWASSKTATSPQYEAGGKYSKNAKITLYAVWEPEVYTVNFDANGGKGDLESVKLTYGNSMRMPNNLVNTGYYLRGWAANKNAAEPQYKIGVDYKFETNTTLYAVWGSAGWNMEIAQSFAGGDGSAQNPYQISNAAELALLAQTVNSQKSAPEYKYYILTDNINLSYNEWIPIGLFDGENQYFKGSFNGNGFTVSDLYITKPNAGNIGLFGYTKDSEIKNVTITGAIENVTSTGEIAVGGIAARSLNTNIQNCNARYFTISGITSGTDICSGVGCIVGVASAGGGVFDCSVNESSINLKSGRFHGGMICGQCRVDLKNCSVNASENNGLFSTVSTIDYICIGGLCGSLYKTAETCSVNAPYLTNEIQTPAASEIGGLVGYLEGEVKVCSVQFKNGKLKSVNGENYNSSMYANSTYSTWIGGIVGRAETNNAKIVDCKYDGQSISAISDLGFGVTGGIAGRMTAKTNSAVTVNGGQTLSREVLPKKTGYKAAWYTDSSLKTPYDFSNPVTSDMTLYAKWEEGTDEIDIWDGTSKEPAYNPDTKTYTITNGEELAWVSDVTNGIIKGGTNYPVNRTFSGYTIELVNDIYLNDISDYTEWSSTKSPSRSWEPIGNSETYYFSGTFNGNNHKIHGIYINMTDNFKGLFGCVSNGIVKNASVCNGYITGGSYTGGIVGNAMDIQIQNCRNSLTINAYKTVGGIAGMLGNNYSSISNCVNTGKISTYSSSAFDVGGIVGRAYGSISYCANTGDISNTYCQTGGIVGTTNTSVTYCYNNGTVSGGINTGGIIGVHEGTGYVQDCYNNANVIGSKSFVGGIVGTNKTNIRRCYNIGYIRGSSFNGGIAGFSENNVDYSYSSFSPAIAESSGNATSYSVKYLSASSMKNLSNLTGFYASVWAVDSSINGGYPYLKSMADTYKTYTVTAVVDDDNTAIKRSLANIDGIVYSESKNYGAYAGGILGEAFGEDAKSKSTANGVISVANNISSIANASSYTAESGYTVGWNKKNYFDFNAAYYNSDVLSNGITNTTGTSRPTSALKIPSFLTGLVGLHAYQSLDHLKEDDTAVWVIKNGELPELYYNCLNDITISSDIENGSITANKQQGIDGEVVEITAAPAEGYVLNKAYVNGEEIVGTTFEINGDSEIYATFTQKTPEYNVSVAANDNVSVSLVNMDGENADLMSLFSADEKSNITAADGEEIKVNAVADEEYTVDAVYINGEEIVGDNFILTENTKVTLDVSSISTETKVITNEPEHIDSHFAVLSGNVDEGNDNIRYMRYWKESKPDEIYVTDIEKGGGEYLVLIDGLETETSYCYQMNDNGEIKTFTTLAESKESDPDTPAYTKGDINGDGDVDVADAIILLKHDSGESILTGDKLKAGDVNGDGEADFADAILILKYDAGIISTF